MRSGTHATHFRFSLATGIGMRSARFFSVTSLSSDSSMALLNCWSCVVDTSSKVATLVMCDITPVSTHLPMPSMFFLMKSPYSAANRSGYDFTCWDIDCQRTSVGTTSPCPSEASASLPSFHCFAKLFHRSLSSLEYATFSGDCAS